MANRHWMASSRALLTENVRKPTVHQKCPLATYLSNPDVLSTKVKEVHRCHSIDGGLWRLIFDKTVPSDKENKYYINGILPTKESQIMTGISKRFLPSYYRKSSFNQQSYLAHLTLWLTSAGGPDIIFFVTMYGQPVVRIEHYMKKRAVSRRPG